VLPNYKEIFDLIKKGSTVEAQERIQELRERVITLQEENNSLRERVRELEEAVSTKESLIWDPPYYFLATEAGKDGPYCQHCWDSEGKLIRLQQPGRGGYWKCIACDKAFKDANYEPPSGGVVRTRSDFWGNF